MRDRLPGLDGLRGIACLLVVAHHLEVPGLRGGWVGVDVFFVLSGYLITGLLLAERERSGRIRLKAFYLRRAARLYPALLVTVAVATALTMPHPGKSSFWALSYLADYQSARGHDIGSYDHTWSLAVEEQFYLLWPAALLVLRSRRAVLTVVAGVGSVSLSSMVVSGWSMSAFAYAGPHARAWELLAGAGLAVAGRHGLPPLWSQLMLLAGAAAVVAGVWVGHVPRPWVASVVTSAGTVALLAACRCPQVAIPLEWPVLAWTGKRSYGIYLFHFPLLLAWSKHSSDGWAFRALALGLATVLGAWASYRWIEEPIRRRVADFAQRTSASGQPTTVTSELVHGGTGIRGSRVP